MRQIPRALLLGGLLLAAHGSNAAEPEQAPQAQADAVEIAVVPLEKEYLYGQPVKVRFDVKNRSQETVALWSRSCSWGYKVYCFELTTSDGTTIELSEPQRAWFRNVPTKQDIEPGKTFSVEFDLMKLSAGPLPIGTYTVRASYRSAPFSRDNPDYDGRLRGLWVGQLQAKPFEVTLKPAWKPAEITQPRVVWIDPAEHNESLMIAYPANVPLKADQTVAIYAAPLAGAPTDRTPRVLLAAAKIKTVHASANMAWAAVELGKRFDKIEIGDEGRASDAALAEYKVQPAANQPKDRNGIVFNYGPLVFMAVFERNEGAKNCTLHVERVNSRNKEGQTFTVWKSVFSSWPDAYWFEDGLIVAENEFRTYVIDPLSGQTVRNEARNPGDN